MCGLRGSGQTETFAGRSSGSGPVIGGKHDSGTPGKAIHAGCSGSMTPIGAANSERRLSASARTLALASAVSGGCVVVSLVLIMIRLLSGLDRCGRLPNDRSPRDRDE